MDRKRICWITSDSFVDTDLNFTNMCEIAKLFDIHWIILFGKSNNRFKENDFEPLQKAVSNISIEFMYSSYRIRNPKNILFYCQLGKKIKKLNSDIVYLNVSVNSPWMLPLFFSLDSKCLIMTAHQGEVHIGMEHKWLTNTLRRIVYSRMNNVNMFSKSQAALFMKHFPKIKIFQIPLPLKNFGKANQLADKDKRVVRFLSFGTINFAKNIDLLIDAGCKLYEKGYRNFNISINGMCKDWRFYQERIKYPEIFDINIRSIDNSEIPNLFSRSHYLVQPYRVVSQSGPTKIAFYYHTPIIATNLPGFSDEISEGINGFLFQNEDVDDLVRVMEEAVNRSQDEYNKLKNSMQHYTELHYSPWQIASKYIDMFKAVLSIE